MHWKIKSLFLLLAAHLFFFGTNMALGASANWTDISSKNAKNGLVSAKKGTETSIVISDSGKIYAAYQDRRERIYASYFDGSRWINLAGGMAGTNAVALNGDKASLAAKGNNLYMAYKDLDSRKKTRVRKWDGSRWSDVADANHAFGYISNLGGFEPILCLDDAGENLYAAFRDEASGERIKVMRWNENSGWSDAEDPNNPGGLISNSTASEVDIKAAKNSQDIFAAFEDRANGNKIVVKKWNGTNWNELSDENHPGGIASAIAGYSPSIDTDSEGNLYLVYTGKNAKNTHIQKWNGYRWEGIGNGYVIRGKTIESSIAIDDRGYAYVAYSQKAKGAWRVRAKVWTGFLWFDAQDAKSKNISKGKGKGDPSLAVFENKLYISFTDARNKNKARVKMLNFE